MNMNKKGTTVFDEFLVSVMSALLVTVALLIVFAATGISAKENVKKETISSIDLTDVTVIHQTYLHYPYKEGTVQDELLAISIMDNKDEQKKRLDDVQTYTATFLKNYPDILWDYRIITPTNTLDYAVVSSQEQTVGEGILATNQPTLTNRYGKSCITLPTTRNTDVTFKLVIHNLNDPTTQEDYQGALDENC